jgi:alpha-glucosidase
MKRFFKFIDFLKEKLIFNCVDPILNGRHAPHKWTYLTDFKSLSLNKEHTTLTINCLNGKIILDCLTPSIWRIIVTGQGLDSSFKKLFPQTDYLTWSVILRQSSCLQISQEHGKIYIESVASNKKQGLLAAVFDTAHLSFEIKYGSRLLHKDLKPPAFNQEWVACFKQGSEQEQYFGFGEKTGSLCKNNKTLKMWNTNTADMNTKTDPLYQTCPLQIAVRKDGFAHALFFDNPNYCQFKLNEYHKLPNTSYAAEGGPLCYYVIAGSQLKEVLSKFTDLCGKYPLPPRWVLGHHHSRYEAKESAERILKIASEFRKRHIPCDVIHIDIGHMEGYRSFTWNKKRFPGPAETIKKLKTKQFKTVIMSDPGLKKDPEWDIYKQGVKNGYFCTHKNGAIYHGPVWPGASAFPDFTSSQVQSWWGSLYRIYTESGIDGYWIDMNEPAIFTPLLTMPRHILHNSDRTRPALRHKTVHNCYGLLMAKATYQGLSKLRKGLRTFLFSRSAFAGIQRYAASWTGDIKSKWSHLQNSIPMLLNMGLSGQVIIGSDIGGFLGKPTKELFIRWMQLGAFYPFSRNHTTDGSPPQEIWYFGEQAEEICRQALKIRYQLLPYLYTHLKQACDSGVPLMRPLFLEFPADKICLDEKAAATEFLIGPDLLVAPVLNKGARQRRVYLPQGNDWIEWNTCIHYKGGTWIKFPAPLEKIPLFVRKGAILPTSVPVEVSEEIDNQTPIILVFPDQSCHGRFYLDDGYTLKVNQDKFSDLLMQAKLEKNSFTLRIERLAGKLMPVLYKYRGLIIKICLAGLSAPIKNVLSKNKPLAKSSWEIEDKWVVVRLKNPSIPLRLTFII